MNLVVAFAMAFTVFGYGFAAEADAAVKKPTKITLSSSYTTVDIKGKITVKVKSVSPSNASKSVTWKSSNKKIATVSSSGVVTGKKTGTVKITATSKSNKKVSKSITIRVKQIKPSLSMSNVYVYTRDGYVSVKAKMPSNVYNAGVSYKISNSKYAKLKTSKTSTKGYSSLKARTGYVYVAPVKAASKYVTLTATSKENSKVKKSCRVYVRQSVDKIAFDSAKLDENLLELEAGTSETVKAKVTKPSKPYSKTLVYSSSDKSVATVDSSGKVTARKAGYALIKATAKYGNRNKAAAQYYLAVYDKLNPTFEGAKAVYTVDMNKYDFYEITGERNGEDLGIVLDNDDLKNLTGNGNSEFDWMHADAGAFEKTEFVYSAGEDYIFAKEGNEVYIKFGDSIFGASWYYVKDKDSFKAGKGSDYTITLYSTVDGNVHPDEKIDTVETIEIVKSGDTIKAEKGGRAIAITLETAGEYSLYIKKAAGSERTVTVKEVSNDVYKIILDKQDVEKYKAEVKAYVK